MSRQSCPACGATIDLARDAAGEVVPLEVNTDTGSEAPRYRVSNVGPPLRVERVPDQASGEFYPDHRFDCKDFNAGHTFR